MYHGLLGDSSFFEFLARIDADLAETARASGCRICRGRLHRAGYPRKPRGLPAGVKGYQSRASFCCAREGCRRRTTPSSVRFLGRKVYVSVVVILATAMSHGVTPRRAERLGAELEVSRQTLERWRTWWQETFVGHRFWRAARARLSPPVDETGLPATLLERFAGDAKERLVSMLRFIAPVTSETAHAW